MGFFMFGLDTSVTLLFRSRVVAISVEYLFSFSGYGKFNGRSYFKFNSLIAKSLALLFTGDLAIL
jgi:hypothetical protein